jgi:hypothetical protein
MWCRSVCGWVKPAWTLGLMRRRAPAWRGHGYTMDGTNAVRNTAMGNTTDKMKKGIQDAAGAVKKGVDKGKATAARGADKVKHA